MRTVFLIKTILLSPLTLQVVCRWALSVKKNYRPVTSADGDENYYGPEIYEEDHDDQKLILTPNTSNISGEVP